MWFQPHYINTGQNLELSSKKTSLKFHRIYNFPLIQKLLMLVIFAPQPFKFQKPEVQKFNQNCSHQTLPQFFDRNHQNRPQCMYSNDVGSLKEEVHCDIQYCPSEQRVCVNCTNSHFRTYVAQKFYMFSKSFMSII